MTKETRRTSNLLGATVLGLHDEIRHAVEKGSGHAGEAPSAISALGHQPGLSNDALSRLLNLTHTGTVRLIDRLVADGLVERRPSARDKRGVALHLTEAGETTRAQILEDRAERLEPLVSALTAREQKTLADLLSKLLVSVSRDDGHKLRICRLCDSGACGNCPILVPIEPQDAG